MWVFLFSGGRDLFCQHQETRSLAGPNFLSVRVLVLYSQPLRFVRFNGISENRRLPVLDQARGSDSWCWPKGLRPLRTRMSMSNIVAGPASAHARSCHISLQISMISFSSSPCLVLLWILFSVFGLSHLRFSLCSSSTRMHQEIWFSAVFCCRVGAWHK